MKPGNSVKTMLLMLGLTSTAKGFDYAGAIRCGKPGQLQSVTGINQADTFIDKEGKEKPLDFTKAFTNTSIKLKNDHLFAAINLPLTSIDNDTLDQKVTGIGDISFDIGPHFKKDNLYIMPVAHYWLGTGDYDNNRKVHLGTGNDWAGASLWLTYLDKKHVADFSVLHKRELGGDNYSTIFNAAYGQKTGNWIIGGGASDTLGYGGMEKTSVGPLIRYCGKDKSHYTLAIEKDVHSRNTSKGWTVTIGARIPFGEKPSHFLDHNKLQRNYKK